jgi:N6-adenosine-specific RNA methylase IME4
VANIVPANNPVLLRLDAACRALAEAKSLDVVKLLRDNAQLFQHYSRERGYGLQALNDAAEIKLRAERRLGELIPECFPHGGDRRTDSTSHDVRLKDLGISYMDSHRWQKMARVPAEDFEQHVAEVRERGDELTTAGVLRLAKKLEQPGKQEESPGAPGCTLEDLATLIDQGESFGTIYADPPWQYGNQATRASTDNHYKTMTVDEIAALPIQQLAEEKAHLHLWTTNGFLRDAFRVMDAWGFEYKSVFVWCKPQMGLGNYWRVSHELMLLGVRGGLRFPETERGIKSWCIIDRGRHSGKPEQVRRLIERVSPAPRLELFGRMALQGWAVWGNEVDRDLFTQGVEAR